MESSCMIYINGSDPIGTVGEAFVRQRVGSLLQNTLNTLNQEIAITPTRYPYLRFDDNGMPLSGNWVEINYEFNSCLCTYLLDKTMKTYTKSAANEKFWEVVA